MVDKAQPSSRMFEEHVRPLLARLPLFVMENVFRFESLIYGQVNGIIGIRYASRGVYGRIHDVVDLVDHVHRFLVGQHLFLLLFLPRSLDRRRHSPVVRLREVGRSLDAELVKERKLLHLRFPCACTFAKQNICFWGTSGFEISGGRNSSMHENILALNYIICIGQ